MNGDAETKKILTADDITQEQLDAICKEQTPKLDDYSKEQENPE